MTSYLMTILDKLHAPWYKLFSSKCIHNVQSWDITVQRSLVKYVQVEISAQ